jgi:hypothetical protein
MVTASIVGVWIERVRRRRRRRRTGLLCVGAIYLLILKKQVRSSDLFLTCLFMIVYCSL